MNDPSDRRKRSALRRLPAPSDDTWYDVAKRSREATFFHTPQWAAWMAAEVEGLEIATQAFALADGATAILPRLRWPNGRFAFGCESMVPGVYGGPIAPRPLSGAEVESILDASLGATETSLRVTGNPYGDAYRSEGEGDDFSHWIDIDGPFEELLAAFSQNHRRSYRYAQEAGLRARTAESLDDFLAYHRIYRETRQRWGDNALNDDGEGLFRSIFEARDSKAVLWLAEHDGEIVAGDLWLYWNRTNVGWHGASRKGSEKLYATNFLITEVLRDACRRELPHLDLGPSGGLEGVARFKDAFGARRVPFRNARRSAAPWKARTLAGAERWTRRLERLVAGAATPNPQDPEGR